MTLEIEVSSNNRVLLVVDTCTYIPGRYDTTDDRFEKTVALIREELAAVEERMRVAREIARLLNRLLNLEKPK